MAEEVFISYGSADRERIQRVEYFEGNEDESIGGVLRALKRLGISTNSDSENQARNQVSASEPQGKAKSPALALASIAIVALLALVFILKPSAPTNQSATATQPETKPLEKNGLSFCRLKTSAHRARTITSSMGSSMIPIS